MSDLDLNLAKLGKVGNLRVDFDVNDYNTLIFEKGLKTLWQRALECPCRLNSQTEQADPTCLSCEGEGLLYVKPAEAKTPDKYLCECDDGSDFLDTATAKATQLIFQAMTKDPQVFEKLGEWIFGTVSVTAFSFHRIGFRDRLTLVDAVMSYRQVLPLPESRIIVPGAPNATKTKLRYPVVSLLEALTVVPTTGVGTSYLDSTTVGTDGSLTFDAVDGPDVGDLVTIAYNIRPRFVIQDHVYAVRNSPRAAKSSSKLGTEVELPLRAMARLDFVG